MKFRVCVERTDIYHDWLTVEASSTRVAGDLVGAKLDAHGWAGAFPDDRDGDYISCDSCVRYVIDGGDS